MTSNAPSIPSILPTDTVLEERRGQLYNPKYDGNGERKKERESPDIDPLKSVKIR